jgi:two-component system chemotaxis sensor kinase CheA
MHESTADALMDDFGIEARERIGRVEEILLRLPDAPAETFEPLLDQLRRDLHTLKGNSALVGLTDLQRLAHRMEDLVAVLAPERTGVAPILAAVDRFRTLLRAAAPGATDAEIAVAAAAAATEEPPLLAFGAAAGSEIDTASARVPFATIDSLIDLLAEMVMFRNRLSDGLERCGGPLALARSSPQAAAPATTTTPTTSTTTAPAPAAAAPPAALPVTAPGRAGEGGALAAAWEQVEEAHQRLGSILDLLQQGILRLRMVPLRSLFGPLRRLVHDECAVQGKVVQVLTAEGDTPLDKGLLELAGEVLGHLVRNAVTHGIETPAERRAAGKPEQGTLRLRAAATTREVRIDVEDDGRGLRGDEIAAAAERLGLAERAAADPAQLVFLPGVSTRRDADLSGGRGIGLAAVRSAVERRGGRVEVASEEGVGCLFRLTLPLSASITRALLLRCDAEIYALPVRSVLEGLRFQPGQVHEVNGAGVLRWRGKVLPALDLGCSFGTAPVRRAQGYAVVIEEGARRRALLVDEIQGTHEIVVKALDPVVGRGEGLAGSTVLGDGRAVLILDPPGLLDLPPFVGAPA